jgi:tRNA nucleotidyltransferase (CCA-adding enzyme)
VTSAYDVDLLVRALSRSVPREVLLMSQTFADAGFRSWLVGGSVRDVVRATLAGAEPHVIADWDIATDAHPQEVRKLFRKVIPTGIAHGTVTVVSSGQHFEVTTLRGEKGHTDGRRPDEVFFVADLTEDLARRDFTVNAMAYSVMEKAFYDPFFGVEDLLAGVLRAVGDPAKRFAEDGLRVLRCARFCATLSLAIEENTKHAIAPSLPTFEKVAQERVAEEWFKALKSRSPSRFFRAAKEHGLLHVTAPYLFSSSATLLDFDEALNRIDSVQDDPTLRLATFVRSGTALESEPAEIARAFCGRLRLSKEQTSRIVRLCSSALLPESLQQDASGYAGRRWLSQIGRAHAEEVLAFQQLMRPLSWNAAALTTRHEELRTELASGCALSLKELQVTGSDLIQEAGISKGPELGQTLARLFEAVLLDPSMNDRRRLLDLAIEA